MQQLSMQKRGDNVQKTIFLNIWYHELLAGHPEWMDVYVVEEADE